jgi:hypothetical protein
MSGCREVISSVWVSKFFVSSSLNMSVKGVLAFFEGSLEMANICERAPE